MSVASANSPVSLQESQLLQILQQQAAFRAKANGTETPADSTATDAGQNLPTGTDVQGAPSIENLDTDLSPDKISALLLALQTQQASLSTTLLLGGSSTGGTGKTLVDYLTANPDSNSNSNDLVNPLTDDGTSADDAEGVANGSRTLVDYLS